MLSGGFGRSEVWGAFFFAFSPSTFGKEKADPSDYVPRS